MKVRTQQYSEGLRKMKCNSAMIVNHFNKPYLALEIPEREMIDWLKVNETRLPMDIDIKIKRKKRSIDSNSLFWKIADEVAIALGITKEEVYQKIVHEVGVFSDVAIKNDAVTNFVSGWKAKGLGWFTEPLGKNDKYTVIRCYHGSSSYDSKQMSRLIDSVMEEAKELGLHIELEGERA